ncbi:MAG: efflux RND transporter periplasmic adaptor subunit [Planctomycetota bacterium]
MALIVLLIVLLISVIGCESNRTVQKKKTPVKPVPVQVVSVVQTDLPRTTTQPATVHAYFEATLRPRTSGYVRELRADIGDAVRQGQTLAVIDVPELLASREVHESRVERLKAFEDQVAARIELAVAGRISAEAGVVQAESERAGIEASRKAADAELDRTRDLVGRGSLQQRVLDEATLRSEAESARAESADAAITAAQAQVQVAQAEIAAVESELEAARAETRVAINQLSELNVQIGFADIVAPFDGVITERHIEPGDLVGNNQSDPPLFMLSQTDRLRLRIAVPEADAPLVNPGDVVVLTLPTFEREEPVTGTVARRSGNLDAATRTMMVEADLPNPDGKLLPGMFGEATIALTTKVAAHVLPSRAIRFDEQGAAFVYALSDEDRVTKHSIDVGMDDGHQIEVRGLSRGDRIIASHLNRFVDGQLVAVLK